MIEAAGLTKRYGGTTAVDDLSFTVPPGQVTGFLGPNGAGKSTTMRLILGLDAPDAGSVTVGGRPYAAWRRPLFQAGALSSSGACCLARSIPPTKWTTATPPPTSRPASPAEPDPYRPVGGLHGVTHRGPLHIAGASSAEVTVRGMPIMVMPMALQ